MVKGLAYSLEAMMASVLVFVFLFGAVEVGETTQDWSEYQTEIAANDLSYSLEMSGKLENFSKRGETGSIQTAVNVISDRDLEVSGSVSNLPTAPIDIAYATPKDKQNVSSIDQVQPGDRCSGNLTEIQSGTTDPIYRSDGSLETKYNARLYFSNTSLSGNYDTLWIDNGTQECQFDPTKHRFNIEEIFNWKNNTVSDHYEFTDIDIPANEATYFKASQAMNIENYTSRDVNGIKTDVAFDMINRTGFTPKSPEYTHIINVAQPPKNLTVEEINNSRVHGNPPGRVLRADIITYYKGLEGTNFYFDAYFPLNANESIIDGRRVFSVDKKDEGGYNNKQLKLITSAIYWSAGQRRTFESRGGNPRAATQVVGGVKKDIFMPYVVNLRWLK